MPDVLHIHGVVMRMCVHGRPRASTLGGPLLMAGAGARCLGVRGVLVGAIPSECSSSEMEMIRAIAAPESTLITLDETPLAWHGPAICGQHTHRELLGAPQRWHHPEPPPSPGRVVLANADPNWSLPMLLRDRPRSIFADLDAAWGPSRIRSAAEIARRARIVTIGERDLGEWPEIKEASTHDEGILVVKRGEHGLRVVLKGVQVELPAPIDTHEVLCDVGAGDLLIGLLGAAMPEEMSIDRIVEAYGMARGIIRRLLSSGHPSDFLAEAAKHDLSHCEAGRHR